MREFIRLSLFVYLAIWEFIMGKPDWCFVIKYTNDNYVGVVIDAYFVVDSCDALDRGVESNPIKPGEMVRAVWTLNNRQRNSAAELHETRMRERREFELLMAEINEAWMSAEERARR